MRFDELIADGPLDLGRGPDTALGDLVDDSRLVTPGCCFVARGGTAGDGAAYVREAVERGAVAVIGGPEAARLVPRALALATPRAGTAVDQALAGLLADRFFDHPALRLRLVAVTGTNGKTTTATIARHLLQAAGLRTALMGTIQVDDGTPGGARPAALTTPGAIELRRLLAAMVRSGCAAAVMEASSHALDQGRTRHLSIQAAVFTNLTGDHLDYHHTMDAYADAKATLFDDLDDRAWAIVNADDAESGRMLRRCRAAVLTTSLDDLPGASCRAAVAGARDDGSDARFDGPWGSFEAHVPLVGRHNVANALQAVAAAAALTDLDGPALRRAVESCPPVPGRLERVPGRGPTVLVDYAHTHDALSNVLRALRPLARGRLVAVVGCGGDRDRTKRPRMAAVACAGADRVLLTSDNPRTEDPAAILDDMLEGVPDRNGVEVIPDRAAAIGAAIGGADAQDTVLLAGKGHEDYQIIGTEKSHFDDREHAAAALRSWEKENAGRCRPPENPT